MLTQEEAQSNLEAILEAWKNRQPVEIERGGKPWWVSNPGPQTNLFYCPADIICFGGARGSSKSESAVPWAAGFHCFEGPQYFDVSRYRAVIFRRTLPELKRHIIERSHYFLQGWWKYTDREHTWERKTADGGRAILEFAYLERPSDVFRYTGAEYARIVIDESNMYSEREVRFMVTCMRTSAKGVKPQMLLLPNPVGPGYGWHKQLFVGRKGPKRVFPPYLYTDSVWPSDGKDVRMSTAFIPAKVWDNPPLLQNDPAYLDRLRSQHGKLAEALINGSWEEGEHIAFDQYNEYQHCIPAFNEEPKMFAVPPWAETWLGIDWGGTGKKAKDFASAVMLAADSKRVYGCWDHTRKGKDIVPFAHEVIERVRMTKELQKPRFAVLSHECFADKGMGNTQADQFASVLDKEGITVVRSDRDPQARLILVREFLRIIPIEHSIIGHDSNDFEYWRERFRKEGAAAGDEYMRITGMVKDEETLPKMVFLLPTPDGRYGCLDLMKNLPLLAVDPENPLVIAEGQDDDSFDALGHALRAFVSGPVRPMEEFYKDVLGENRPDSTIGLTLAEEEARRRFEGQEEMPSGPIPWPMKRFE